MKLNYSIIVGYVLVSFFLASCGIDQPEERPLVALEDYLGTINASDLTETDSGMFYKIVEPGDEGTIEHGDIVVSDVILFGLDGSILFDSQISGSWHYLLSEQSYLTPGMIEAVPLIQVGGEITIYLPSKLGYGSLGLSQVGIRPGEDLGMNIKHRRVKMTIPEYIEANEIENVEITTTGLYYVLTEEGEGDFPMVNQTVSVNYIGTFMNGTQFDSSFDRGTPISFNVGSGSVIAGWEEGIKQFKKGGKGLLLIPYFLAYGANGSYNESTGGYSIFPYEHLVFEIELVDIQS